MVENRPLYRMNWVTKTRTKLNPSVSKINFFAKISDDGSNEWSTIRKNVITKYKNECRYCGISYKKYMRCIHLNGNNKDNRMENLEISCKGCYSITHLNAGFTIDDVVLCYSEMSQLSIVRKSISYIATKGGVPVPSSIDKDVKRVPISVVEYVNLLLTYDRPEMPTEMRNYKLFFSQNFDTQFVDSLINNVTTNTGTKTSSKTIASSTTKKGSGSKEKDNYMFIDAVAVSDSESYESDLDSESEKEQEEKGEGDPENQLEQYELSPNEMAFLKKHFVGSFDKKDTVLTQMEQTIATHLAIDIDIDI